MIEKTLMIILFVCSAIMMIVGITHDPPWVLHIIFGFLAFATATTILMDYLARNAPYYDEENHRYYRFANNGDSPHHGQCPRCKSRARVIYTTTNKRRYGVRCIHHGEVWFDLEEKELKCLPTGNP